MTMCTCLVPAIRNGVRTPSTKTMFLPVPFGAASTNKKQTVLEISWELGRLTPLLFPPIQDLWIKCEKSVSVDV